MGQKSETIISPHRRIDVIQLMRELRDYGGLIWMLSYRDIRIRYAQTFLGISWSVINPMITMLLLYFVFSIVTRVDTQGIPAMVYILAGLTAWTYFARTVGESGQSLIGAQSLVKKIYFPRMVIPISKAISGLMELGIVLILLVLMLILYRLPFHGQMLMIVPFLLLLILTSLGLGIWVAALSIRFRDFNHMLPLMLRIGLFLSPVAYGAALVPDQYATLYNLNPLTGIIEGIRWSLFDTPLPVEQVWISIGVMSILLATGIWYFQRMEQYIADII